MVPLRRPTPWAVPGDGKPTAVIDGFEGAKRAIELVEIDAGRVVWRDTVHCAAPVIGVTAEAIVCADARGVRAVGLDGKSRWKRDEALAAITGGRIVLVGPTEAIVPVKKPLPPRRPVRRVRPRPGVRPPPAPAPVPATRATAIVVDAASGQDVARVALPAGMAVESVLAACGTDELFAYAAGKLSRIASGKVAWSIPSGAIAELDACTGDAIHLITPAGRDSTVIALARATGLQTGRVDGVRGTWPARDSAERVELVTATGIASWSRDLTEYQAREDLPLGELLALRGERRLVRATPLTAVLLDRGGVAAYLPFAALAAALGSTSIIGGTWIGDGEHVRRFAIPERTRRTLRVPARRGPLALPAELRDLPKPTPLDLGTAIAMRDTGMHAVDAIVLDPAEPTVLYAVARERPGEPAGVASADLAKRSWRWQRRDGCGGPDPVGLALVRDAVICAARGTTAAIVATSRDGKSRWQWETDHLDAIAAAGDVVLGFAADQLFVLDASTGKLRGQLASEDGAAMRAAVLAIDNVSFLVSYERGRLVVRSPHTSMIALWSLAVGGVVSAIAASHEGVLVELDDGDAFRVELETASVVPLPGFGLGWHASGDLVTGEAIGGPVPAPPVPRPVAKVPVRRVVRRPLRPIVPPREPGRPAIWTPIPIPPPLGDSWQYTIFELTGGVRARNDYALVRPIEPSGVRGPIGSPLVVAHDGALQVLVLDPRNGDPLRRVALPAPGLVFGTIVDGTPVAGAVLAAPLRVVMF